MGIFWPQRWIEPNIMLAITFLELVPIVLAFFLFKTQFLDKKILFHTDNKALVSILNKKSSKSVMELVRPLVLHSLVNIIFLKLVTLLVITMLLLIQFLASRTRFCALAPESNLHPIPIPEDFIGMISELKLNA